MYFFRISAQPFPAISAASNCSEHFDPLHFGLLKGFEGPGGFKWLREELHTTENHNKKRQRKLTNVLMRA